METGSAGTWFMDGILVMLIVFAALSLLWLVVFLLFRVVRGMEKVKMPQPKPPEHKKDPHHRLYVALAVCCVAAPVLLVAGINLLMM